MMKNNFNFTITAEPGAGKTLAVLAQAHLLFKKNLINFIIIAVPLNSIKLNWVTPAKEFFNLDLVEDITNPTLFKWNGKAPNDIKNSL